MKSKDALSNLGKLTLFGVYDADATAIGETIYWFGARLGIRHCSLCDITHSLFRQKSQWRDCVTRLQTDHSISFLAYHRNDQPAEVRQVIKGEYPAVVARSTQSKFTLFLSRAEINECGSDPDKFFRQIIEKLAKNPD